jgi:hypothetical protein
MLCAGAFVLLGLAAGCGDGAASGAGQPQAQTARLYIEAVSSFGPSSSENPRPLHFDDPRGTVYSLTSARLGVESIALIFSAPKSCADAEIFDPALMKGVECTSHELVIRGPFVIDLLNGGIEAAESTQSNWTIPALDYRRVELRLAPFSTRSNSRHTLRAQASFGMTDSIRELSVRFRFRATAGDSIAAPLLPGDSLVLGLNVAEWLERIPVTRCVQNGHLSQRGGRVTLDSNLDARPVASYMHDPPRDCADALPRFRMNLKNSLNATIEARPPGDADRSARHHVILIFRGFAGFDDGADSS